jgi:hypothetical protein
MARPPTDPALVAEALAWCAPPHNLAPQEAAEKMGGRISWRTIYRAQEDARKKGTAPAKVVAAKAAPVLPEPMAKAPPVPANLEGAARRLWIVRSRIDAMRDALAEADATNNLPRMGSLTKNLLDLLEQEALLAPTKAATADEEERRWREQADIVLQLIEQGVTAAEKRAAA